MWDNIYQPYQTGSEGGLIIADEEYRDSCRITLEKCERYYAITCGVYGGMMHTALEKYYMLWHIVLYLRNFLSNIQ